MKRCDGSIVVVVIVEDDLTSVKLSPKIVVKEMTALKQFTVVSCYTEIRRMEMK